MGAGEAEEDALLFDLDRVLFHGSGLLVVDKPAGAPVHQGTGHARGVVEDVAIWASLHPGVLDTAPGKKIHPVHLMDLESSGVLILGLTRAATRRAKEVFAAGRVEKRYLAFVSGPLEEEGTVRGKVRSRLRGSTRRVRGELHYRLLEGDERLSLVEVVPEGGGHHIVRALFARSGRPLAGDLRYGKPVPSRRFLEKFGVPHLLIHCRSLTLPEEVLGKPAVFEAPVPETFREVCRRKGWGTTLELEGEGPVGG